MRVVIDTNVMVSAYLGGVLEKIIVAWRAGKFTLNKFLEAALAGRANRIISGDKHLLTLSTYRGIAIITAREFSAGLDK